MPGLCCGSTGASRPRGEHRRLCSTIPAMAHFRGARGRSFLTRCLLLVAALAARGQAAPAETRRACASSTSGAAAGRALQRFTASTGHSGLYDSGLVAGRRSRGVAGHYTAESALRLMLGDSGLQSALRLAGHLHARRRGDSRAGLPAETLAARQRYGKLQAAMRALLCGDRMCARAATARRSACGSATAARCGACACWIPRVRPSAISC